MNSFRMILITCIFYLSLSKVHANNPIRVVGLQEKIDVFFGQFVVNPLAKVLFWEIPFLEMPLVVAWLFGGALFFTFRMGFVNVRLFKHAIELIRGKFDSSDQKGEVTHFQALTTALSATLSLIHI